MTSGDRDERIERPGLRGLAAYFLRLGALGFGGPVALANAMRRDLVERRRWIAEGEYDRGLAIAAACPGPLAYQLGVYCGFLRRGIAGGVVVALCFALPPFLLVVCAGALYTRFAGSWPLRALFYGVGRVVVALIVKACWNLGRKTLGPDRAAWALFLVALGLTVALERELTAIFIAAGILGAFVFASGPKGEAAARTSDGSPPPERPDGGRALSPSGRRRPGGPRSRVLRWRASCFSSFSRQDVSSSEAGSSSCRFSRRTLSTSITGSGTGSSWTPWRSE